MNAADWLIAGEYTILSHGPRGNFRAVEIAPVGRKRGNIALQAPPPELFRNAILLRDLVLEVVRLAEGIAPIHVTSWYRDEAYNKAVGGAPGSIHMTCGAADIMKSGWHPLRLALWLHHRHPSADKLGIGYYRPASGRSGFVHVDIRGFMEPSRLNQRFGDTPGWWQQSYESAPK